MSIYRKMFDKFNNIIEYIKFFNSWIKFKKIADKELLNKILHMLNILLLIKK